MKPPKNQKLKISTISTVSIQSVRDFDRPISMQVLKTSLSDRDPIGRDFIE